MTIDQKLELIDIILDSKFKINTDDYINLNHKQILSDLVKKYGITKVINFTDIGSRNNRTKDYGRFKIENKCKTCGKIEVAEVSKTDLTRLLKEDYECNSCQSKKIAEQEARLKKEREESKIKREKEIRELHYSYVNTILNPNCQFENDISYKDRWDAVNDIRINREIIKEIIHKLPYREFLKTPYWKAVSLRAKYKADYKCMLCSSNKNLETHHPNYDILGDELNNMNKLVVLCHSCHDKHHK